MSPTSYRTAPPRAIVTTIRPANWEPQIRNSQFEIRNSLVGLGRVELPTSRLSGVRSNQLSYRPITFLSARLAAKKSHTSRSAVRFNGGRAQGRVASVAIKQLPAIYFS